MNKQLLKDALGWGFALWLSCYILGFIFFAIIPQFLIGWVIMPIGIVITLRVLFEKVDGDTFHYYCFTAFAWTIIAVVLDYLCIVQLLHPADGYYKLDVYLYYALTFVLPLIIGWYKRNHFKSRGVL